VTARASLDLALLAAYVALSVAGLHLLKSSAGAFMSASFGLGLSCYGAGFLLWYLLLTKLPLSVAFPLASGALILGSQVVGHAMFGEVLGPRHLAGVLLIVIGLALVLPRQVQP
jgi:multidrug transporter EmrE-like cation transporter